MRGLLHFLAYHCDFFHTVSAHTLSRGVYDRPPSNVKAAVSLVDDLMEEAEEYSCPHTTPPTVRPKRKRAFPVKSNTRILNWLNYLTSVHQPPKTMDFPLEMSNVADSSITKVSCFAASRPPGSSQNNQQQSGCGKVPIVRR